MDDYLIDRETLSQFVDELIKQKSPSVSNPEELSSLKEQSIKELDDQVGLAIFGSLTEEQAAELDQLLDNDDGDPKPYQDFFVKIGLDVEKIITDTMKAYAENFLGGQNAE